METEKNNLATLNVEDWRKPSGGTRTQNVQGPRFAAHD